MLRSQAIVRTDSASRYLQQLCKHWAHRFETEFGETSGRVALPLGKVVFAADGAALAIELVAADAETLDGLREVVVRHIERFAYREALSFAWDDQASSADRGSQGQITLLSGGTVGKQKN